MALHKLLAALVLASALLLNLTTQVDACSCIAVARDICDYVEDADVVLRGTALSRSLQASINDDVTYTIDVTTLYKEEPGETYGQEISFITGGNSAACGVTLVIGEEYLLGLSRAGASIFQPELQGQLTVGLCGLVELWSSVSEDDKCTLEVGCD